MILKIIKVESQTICKDFQDSDSGFKQQKSMFFWVASSVYFKLRYLLLNLLMKSSYKY